MADQKKWFKVWTTLLIDSLSTKIDDIGRFTILGCLIASRGENGKLVTDRKTLQTLLQCDEIPADFIKNFNIIIEEIEGNSNGTLSVTLKNWNKYQVDSTGYDRVKRYRDKQSVTANDNAFVTVQDKSRVDKIRGEKNKKIVPPDFISSLKNNPAYKDIDIEKELSKMDMWLETPAGRGRKKTSRFILNWLNRIDTSIITNKRWSTKEEMKNDNT